MPQERMDAAVPMDAQHAPTGTWKTAQNAVSHSAHTPHRRSETDEEHDADPASHTKILTLLGRFRSSYRTLYVHCMYAVLYVQ